MRRLLAFALSAVLCTGAVAHDNVNVGISIGFNVGEYPRLVRVPGYPVYCDPYVATNYFFYDGLYWVYVNDNWYESGWYNGPWRLVEPVYVPVYVLRVPVRYYRYPPPYFRGWRADAPPHWNERWGHDWETQRSGWNQWNHHASVRPAPLPTYQRSYAGPRYPDALQDQQTIRSEKYRYQPREALTKQHWQQQANADKAPSGSHAQEAQREGGHGNPHKHAKHPDNHDDG